ncbi:hypothetical protein AMTR_s00452p00000380, partial [Amborella trichopoda]
MADLRECALSEDGFRVALEPLEFEQRVQAWQWRLCYCVCAKGQTCKRHSH